ncbi:DUF6265 family protein [Owenweeksia hongkongensis]|uniref:DUF6265 family protein n=1 Tax=Owenweeksia hongkongensis TaxID=253245 RepID=UPI003A939399
MFYLSLLLSIYITAQPQPDNSNFDWLVGTWAEINNTENEQTFEVWEKLGKDTYQGMGYSLKDGDTTFVEELSIANIYGVMHYTADVPGNEEPVSFEIVKSTKSGFICGNPQNDFPKKIEYQYEGDVLTATISGGGKSKTFNFVKQ